MNQINPQLPTVGGSSNTWGDENNAVHRIVIASVNDHDTQLSAMPETIRDTIGAALRAGTGVSIAVDDAGDTITINSTGSGSGSSNPFATPGTAAANTTAINQALAAGGVVQLGPGTWPHNGIVFPAGGKAMLLGSGLESTILVNQSTTATSITIAGVGGGTNPSRPYAASWALRDLTISTTASTFNAGQIGVDLALCVQYDIANVTVAKHDTGFRFNSVWETSHRGITVTQCGAYGYRFISGYAGSTPVSFFDCHVLDCTGVGLSVESDANAIGWFGGDYVGNQMAVTVQNNTARTVSFYSVNFERTLGTTDVQIGSSAGTAAPGMVAFYGCRFFRATTQGGKAIDFQRGSQVIVTGSYFGNYAVAMQQSNLTARLSWNDISSDTIGTALVSSAVGNSNAGSGSVVPSGMITSDPYSGISSTKGVKAVERSLLITYGYNPGSEQGVQGDACLRPDGAAGSRLFFKTSPTVWTPITGL